MDDDFNTPDAFAVMQGVARDLNSAKAAGDAAAASAAAAAAALHGRDPRAAAARPRHVSETRRARASAAGGLSDAEIEEFLQARERRGPPKTLPNRIAFAISLSAAGFVLEDKPGGATEWRRA